VLKAPAIVRCEVRLARLLRPVQSQVDAFRFPSLKGFQPMHCDQVLIQLEPLFVDFARRGQFLRRHDC